MTPHLIIVEIKGQPPLYYAGEDSKELRHVRDGEDYEIGSRVSAKFSEYSHKAVILTMEQADAVGRGELVREFARRHEASVWRRSLNYYKPNGGFYSWFRYI